jgi:competence protein ComEA
MDSASASKPPAVPTAPAAPAPPAVVAAWPRPAQLTLVFLLGAATALLLAHAYSSSRWAGKPTELEPGAISAYRVDLNSADRAEFLQLPGVGEGLAERIEQYRREHGLFEDADELGQVRGVGPATLSRLKPLITARGKPVDEPLPEKSKRPSSSSKKQGGSKVSSKKAASLAVVVDINRATADELQLLPGIGPTLAQRIITARRQEPFRSVDDLRRVSGIGPKKLETLRPYVTVASPNREEDGGQLSNR